MTCMMINVELDIRKFIVCFESTVLPGCVVIIISKIMTTQIPL